MLKQALLFTKNPEIFRQAIACSPICCRMILPSQWRMVWESQPELLLVDISTLDYSDNQPTEYLFRNPFYRPTIIYADTEVLLQVIRQGFPQEDTKSFPEIPQEINKAFDTALLQFDFSPSLKGYRYLKQAFYYQYLNAHEISAVKKDIYESVSSCYATTVYSVERGITFAIRNAYQKNALQFQKIFKQPDKAPSNMKFLKTFYIYMQQMGYF